MWKKNLAIWVIVFGGFGYVSSMMIADSSWLQGEGGLVYDTVLLIKTLFFSSLKMLIAPLIFISLLAGILQLGAVSELGILGKFTMLYYLSTTIIAIVIGLTVVFFVNPWKIENSSNADNKLHQLRVEAQAPIQEVDRSEGRPAVVLKKMAQRIFANPVRAFSETNILGIVFWSLLLGVGWLGLSKKGKVLPELISEIYEVLNKVLGWIIVWAPVGVFAVAFDFQLKFNGVVLQQLLAFCFIVLGATAVHGFIVLPLIASVFGKVSFKEFFKKASKPLMIAFSTSSSSATLPVSLKTCEEEFGVPQSISSFVLPLGATMNMDGTALFEGIAAVFLAYIFGVDLSTFGMISIFFMAIISSIGAPGMPSGSMAGMQIVLIAAGIPLEGIGLLLLIERPLDTFRTAVNVEGDIVGALVVSRYFNKNNAS